MRQEILREGRYGCAFCAATGENPRGAKCPVCRGEGRVFLRPPVVKCAHCKGRGAQERRTTITCTACGGKGYQEVLEPLDICPYCRGSGAEKSNGLPCLKCRGAGMRTVAAGEAVNQT